MFKSFLASCASGLLLLASCACSAGGVSAPGVFNVMDFGAKGDGVVDDAPAIKAAIEAARAEGAKGSLAKVFVPKGTYSLASSFGERQVFSFKGLVNVSVEGEKGSLFLVRDPMKGFFEADGGSKISFKRIAVDYSPLTFTQFKVLDEGKAAQGGMEFSLELMPGYPDPASPQLVKGESVIAYKPDGLMNLEAPLLKMRKLEVQPDGRYKALLAGWQGRPDFVHAGDVLAKNGRHFGKSVFRFVKVSDPSLEEVEVMAGPEVFLLSMESENLRVLNCRVAPPEGSGRLLSTSADGIFNVGGRQGPTIEGCHFAGNGDDNVNIHHTGGFFFGFSSEGDLIVTETPWTKHDDSYRPLWREGDSIELVNSKFERVFLAKAASFKVEARGSLDVLRVKLAPVDGQALDKAFAASFPEASVPYKEMLSFNLDRCGGNFSIKGNVFEKHRARGVLVQSRHGVIEGNKFFNMDGGVMLVGEWHYKDGPLAEDIAVVGNEFKDLGRHISDGAVSISVAGGACKTCEYRRIRIEGNSFVNGLDPAIHIDNASDVVVKGNKILYGPWSDAKSELRVGSRGPVEGVVMEGNSIEPLK